MACAQGILFVPVPSRAPEMKEYPKEEVPETFQALYHVSARNLSYPSSTAVCFPVPDEKVPWEVRGFNSYGASKNRARNYALQLQLQKLWISSGGGGHPHLTQSSYLLYGEGPESIPAFFGRWPQLPSQDLHGTTMPRALCGKPCVKQFVMQDQS